MWGLSCTSMSMESFSPTSSPALSLEYSRITSLAVRRMATPRWLDVPSLLSQVPTCRPAAERETLPWNRPLVKSTSEKSTAAYTAIRSALGFPAHKDWYLWYQAVHAKNFSDKIYAIHGFKVCTVQYSTRFHKFMQNQFKISSWIVIVLCIHHPWLLDLPESILMQPYVYYMVVYISSNQRVQVDTSKNI